MTATKWTRWAPVAAALLAGVLFLTAPALAQSVRPPEGATTNVVPDGPQPGDATGGRVPGEARSNLSDAEMWRAVRRGISGTVSIPDKKAALLVQSEGDNWRAVREGPLVVWGVAALGGMVALLALFYLLRGCIRIEAGRSGRTITRFVSIERSAHWLLAVSFLILAVTGLNVSYGKYWLMPVIGKDVFAAITHYGKLAHNYVAFAFMLGLAMILVMWIKDNLPNRHDFVWLVKGGGMFGKGVHVPARKFNAGQKIIFWLVILGGLSISVSGVSLLFPFEMALFSKTFAVLNALGLDLPTDLAPVQEMQLSTLWHAAMGIFLTCVIIAHIYIGTLGMEGAFDAMGSGEVDLNWAKEHHNLWVKEVLEREGAGADVPHAPSPTPAE